MTAIDNIQKNIDDFNSKIEDKRKILSTCDLHKAECEKKKQDIQIKVTQIENLKNQINDNKKLYEINKCGT
jgi:peptidoglycan hydrolase CwlO-like protein